MSQVKDFPLRENPAADDFLYLITSGDTDYRILINSVLGRLITETIDSTYELSIDDAYHTIRLTFAGATTVTVPLEATTAFTIGTVIKVRNTANVNSVLSPETVDVTLNTKSGLSILPKGEVELVYVGDDEWDLSGDLV